MGSVGNNNNFVSTFGFKNVGERKLFKSIGGSTDYGTVIPTIENVQSYLDTGVFDNFGTSASAKKLIVERIARDMNGRGFEMQISEDGLKLLPNGETGLAIVIGKKGEKWKAKLSRSSGTVSRSGIRGAFDKARH